MELSVFFDIIKKKKLFIVYRVFRNTHELIFINVLIIRKGTHDYSILDHITEEIKQIRVDVFIKEQGF